MKKDLTKIFISLFIVTALLSCITFADETPILRLTLEEAQKMALDNNIKFRLQDSYISDALDKYYDVQDQNKKLSQVPASSFMDYFNRTITPEISEDSAANEVKVSRFEKEELKIISNYNVKVTFLNIKKAQSVLKNKENDTANKLKDLEVAKIKHQLGYITSDGLKDVEKAYSDSTKDQVTALEDLHKEVQTLNKYIGRPLTDYNIDIVYDLVKVDVENLNLDTVRAANIKNNKSFYALEESLQLAKRRYDLTKERYEHFEKLKVDRDRQDRLDAFADAERDYETAKVAFEDATKDLDLNLNATYNSLKNTYESVNRLERDIKDTKDSLDKLKIKYDLGLVAKNDYAKQELVLKSMQNNLDSLLAATEIQYSSLMLYVNTTTASK